MTNNLLLKPIRNTLISITLLCTLSACQTTNYNADSQFTAVADSIVDYRQSSSPYGNIEGVNGYLLANLSPEFLEQQYNKKTQFLAELDAIDAASLSDENQINFSIIPVSYTHLTLPTICSV